MTTNPSALDAVTSHSHASSPELPKLPKLPAAREFYGHDYVGDKIHAGMGFIDEDMEAYATAHARACYKAGSAAAAQAAKQVPIDMVLHCPACGLQHIDAPEQPDPHPSSTGEDDHEVWANPPHRSHLCHGCGHVWRPADVPTNGVQAVTTRGKADSPLAAATSATTLAEAAEAGQVEAPTEALRRKLLSLGYSDTAVNAMRQSTTMMQRAIDARIQLATLADKEEAEWIDSLQPGERGRTSLAATPASPQAPAPQAVVGEASEDIVDQLCRAQFNVTRMHTEYQGKAMSDDVYDVFATLRDDRIPALKRTIRAALTPSPAPSAAPHQGADALREDAERWRLIRTWEHQAAVVDNDGTTLTFRFDGIDPDGFEDDESKWLDAVADAARAALAQHQAPQQGEPN